MLTLFGNGSNVNKVVHPKSLPGKAKVKVKLSTVINNATLAKAKTKTTAERPGPKLDTTMI